MPIAVRVAVSGGTLIESGNVPFEPAMNVQRAMEAAYDADPAHSFSAQYFGKELGYEAVTIAGISAQASVGAENQAYLFWELLVNGTPAAHGMDETKLNDGDAVEWNFTAYESRHEGTRYEQIRDVALSDT
jgi:hypothetical protein